MAIALIGCGGITASHLAAYRKAKYRVVAFTDLDRRRAEERRREYYPKARVFDSVDELLAQTHAPIVDIATHPEERGQLIRKALLAGKHVLSQKPFVTNLSSGRKLVELARRRGLCLAVNQNGRWAPHVSYARLAIEAGLLGAVQTVDLSVYWDHNWVAGTPFDAVRHLALYDFGIHWFDMMCCYLPDRTASRVFASVLATPGQKAAPALSAQAVVDFDGAQASLLLRGDTLRGAGDRTLIVGDRGALISEGPNLNEQTVTLYNDHGWSRPKLTTQWFNDGFDGAMSELQSAVQEGRRPYHDAERNLATLELCFAALASADRGRPLRPGAVKRLPL